MDIHAVHDETCCPLATRFEWPLAAPFDSRLVYLRKGNIYIRGRSALA